MMAKNVAKTEGFLVDEGISRFGLRRIHVITPMTADKALIRLGWTQKMVGEGELMAVLEYDDEDVRMHHLRIYWRNGVENEHKTGDI
jgi:hypothetical protein